MMIAVLLLAHAVVLAAAGRWWLPGASWPLRAPRLGIAVWQVLTAGVVASTVLAGLVLAIPGVRVGGNAGGLLGACMMAVRARYSTPGGAAAGVAGGALALAVLGRLAWCAGSAAAGGRRRRARHDDALTLLARPGPAPGILLLDHDQPAAYCLPGRRRVVLTTGALRCLDGRQLDAVLAHERAHLAARHHLVLAFAAALQAALPFRLFGDAAEQIACLVEMAADAAAARRAHRLVLAGALLALSAARIPAGALGAGGSATGQRVRRLIEPSGQSSRVRRAVASSAMLIAVPVLAFSAPAAAVLSMTGCPVGA
ncbi:MAG: M48 family metalloprotease [Actinomycetota bacterium]